MKKKSVSTSSELVPHPNSVAKHFTPSEVEQSGLGPAFFAVVIAIIALLLLSVFGNSYLTGAYHIPGSSDTIKLANLTFTVNNNARFIAGGYNGPVSAIRAVISGPSGLVFRPGGENSSLSLREVFIITRKLNATALPAGSVIYYDYSFRMWRLADVQRVESLALGYSYSYACGPGGSRYRNGVYLPLYTSSSAVNAFSNNVTVMFVPDLNATCIEARLVEMRYNASAAPIWAPQFVNQTIGYWSLNWTNYPRLGFSAVTYGRYINGAYQSRVYPYFISPGESTLFRADSGIVRIQYAYDTRLR